MSTRAETAFLPAALEIQDTPPPPAGRAILWSIITFFVATIIWASLGKVDIVAVAQGRIIPSGHSKIIQPLEIGTVTAIHVTEGQAVNAGDVLIELDPSSTRADVARLEKELDTARRNAGRLRTLAQWLSGPSDFVAPAHTPDADHLLLSQWREFQDRLAVLQRERDRQIAERQSAQRQVDKLRAVLPIITRRATDQKGLAEQKLLPEQQYLETEQTRLEAFHDLRTQEGRVAELDAAVRELEARIAFTRSEFHRQILERQEEAQRQATAAQQELVKATTRARAQTIVAPVSGVVQQLVVHNVGAIVTPAQELMVLVPEGDVLEVEAMVENKDIGFVQVGQSAEIKVDAFPFTKYGLLSGEIVDLSDDAITNEQLGLVYKSRVRLADNQIVVNGNAVALSPGMTVSVEAKTGTRLLIEYFLSPLLRYKNESARER